MSQEEMREEDSHADWRMEQEAIDKHMCEYYVEQRDYASLESYARVHHLDIDHLREC